MSTSVRLHKRWGPTCVLALMMAGMVALGLWSSRPPPARTPEDPQPLLQIYRQEIPKDLLLALPLRSGDQWRFTALAPTGLAHATFWIEPSGEISEFGPVIRHQVGRVDELAFPAVSAEPLAATAGTKLVVLASHRRAAPNMAQITAAFASEPWPRLPDYCMVRFSLRGVEVTGPKGPRLPEASETAVIESRIRRALVELAKTCDFVLGVALPQTP